jgi:Dyp-type peroxidase family
VVQALLSPGALLRVRALLELEAIQALALCPVLSPEWLERALYLFLTFETPVDGRRWLQRVAARTTSVAAWTGEPSSTVGVALTAWGLRALELPQASLDSFSFEFRQGIVARHLRGDVGGSDPSQWEDGLGTDVIHALLVVAARDEASLAIERVWHEAARDGLAVTVRHVQDGHLLADQREHFGFRDGISQPTIEGTGVLGPPGPDAAIKAGEFILGYTDENDVIPSAPQPDQLGRNGTYLVVRKLAQHVGTFRAFLRNEAPDTVAEERLAAKMVGRWRSGAPLVLAPEADDPVLGGDPIRNNDFRYLGTDGLGLLCPRGAHVRRANPRDALVDDAVNVRRHQILRSGSAYGLPLPPDAVEDGTPRGLMFLAIGTSIGRQFEFVHNQWVNDGNFVGLDAESDPILGANGQGRSFTIPKKPVRQRLFSLPRFVTVRGGEYFFVPGLPALDFLTQPG